MVKKRKQMNTEEFLKTKANVVATEGKLACGTCGKSFKPIDKWNYHCQNCQPCKPLEQDN